MKLLSWNLCYLRDLLELNLTWNQILVFRLKDGSGDIDMDEFIALYTNRKGTVSQDIGRLGQQTAASRANQRQKVVVAKVEVDESLPEKKLETLESAKEDYKKRQQQANIKKFRAIDKDNSGSLDLEEGETFFCYLHL
jgi:hypothetical protein